MEGGNLMCTCSQTHRSITPLKVLADVLNIFSIRWPGVTWCLHYERHPCQVADGMGAGIETLQAAGVLGSHHVAESVTTVMS